MKKLLFIFSLAVIAIFFTIVAMGETMEKKIGGNNMKINISINNTVISATMYDNPTTRDFLKLLPLTLKLDDYAGTEKISKLPKKLSLKDSPSGINPSIGDITYYSPWGNLAIFYRDFGYADGLIILGKLDSDISVLENCQDPCEIKIEQSM